MQIKNAMTGYKKKKIKKNWQPVWDRFRDIFMQICSPATPKLAGNRSILKSYFLFVSHLQLWAQRQQLLFMMQFRIRQKW